MTTEMAPELIDYIHKLCMRLYDTRQAGREVVPEVIFVCSIDGKLRFTSMPNAVRYFLTDRAKRFAPHAVSLHFQQMKVDAERRNERLELICVINPMDVWTKDYADVKIEQARRNSDSHTAAYPLSLKISVSLRWHTLLYTWPYVESGGSFIFSDAGPTSSITRHTPGEVRTGSLWPL